MDQFLSLLPKIVFSVGILYFLLNPLFRHQNTMNRVDFLFLMASLVTVGIYADTTQYLEAGIVLGVLLAGFVGTRLFFRKKKRDGFVLFNVYGKDFPAVRAFLKTTGDAEGLDASEIGYAVKKPYLVVFRTKKRKATGKVVQATEKFIREKIRIHFWPAYVCLLLSFIVLAMIWRF
jgi:hypothetical protein